jgi:hypothetical protein
MGVAETEWIALLLHPYRQKGVSLGRPSRRRQSAVLAIAIRRSKAKSVEHMPRYNEAKQTGCHDCKDHERDDLLHDASSHAERFLAAKPLGITIAKGPQAPEVS